VYHGAFCPFITANDLNNVPIILRNVSALDCNAMPPMNLLQTAWLPIRRVSGHAVIRPHELTADIATNPILDLAWPRADFRIAGLEMLIGLLATACPPEDDEAWQKWWHHPPTPAELEEKLAPFAAAFDLDGDGPRFLQDLEDFPGESLPIERLLIDAPGENTIKRNTDLLVKRDRFAVLGRPAAAMTLYTLQTFAPSGGAGHRTSLRGGGPLTTLVRPWRQNQSDNTLWNLLWANVLNGETPQIADLPRIFPWLAATRRSEGDRGTVLDGPDAHILQAFWGMPRRIRLDFRQARPGEICGLTGVPDDIIVTGFRTRPWGVQYVDAAAEHPLSPTYVPKPGAKPLPVHPQPGGIGYRDWHKFAGTADPEGRFKPAATIETFLSRKPMGRAGKVWAEARLLIGGYDMDNMKARSFIETEMPFFVIADDDERRRFLDFSRSLAQGATEAAGILRAAIRQALDIEDNDKTTVDDARLRFFERTANRFWAILRATLDDDKFRSDDEMAREVFRMAETRQWLDFLRDEACAVFDAAAPLDPLAPDAAGVMKDGKWKPPSVVEARRHLGTGLAGYGKAGNALFDTLGLPRPAQKTPANKAAKIRKGKETADG
jgi:CRISPR system Cascade subunit CasA